MIDAASGPAADPAVPADAGTPGTSPAAESLPAAAPAADAHDALALGWRAFRAHPLQLGCAAALLPLVAVLVFVATLLALTVLSVFLPGRGTDFVAFAQPLVAAASLLGLGAGLVTFLGLVALTAAALRGQRPRMGLLATGLRRLPGLIVAALGALLVLLGSAAVGLSLLWLGDVVLDALGGLILSTSRPGPAAPWLLVPIITVPATLVGAAAVAAFALVLGYGLAGLAAWPVLLVDGASGRRAIVAGWAAMNGRRAPFWGLVVALAGLFVLGGLLPVLGWILAGAIAVAALTAFLLAAAGPRAAEAAGDGWRTGRWSAFVTDAWLLAFWALATMFWVMRGELRHVVRLTGREWVPYGAALSAIAILEPLLIVGLLYLVVWKVWGRTPGRWLVGRGWGRMEWLALPLAVLGLFQLGSAGLGIGRAVPGLLGMGVGQELARHLVAGLPAEYTANPGAGGDMGWFRLMDLDVDDAGGGGIHWTYTVTGTLGHPYYFALAHYRQEATASTALGRLRGDDGETLAGLADEAVAQRYPSMVRLAMRDGGTVLAVEGPADGEADLRRLLALQLSALPAARSATAWLWRRLPAGPERLAPPRGPPGPPPGAGP